MIFGFLVAMGQQVFAALLYAYTPECFPTQVRNTGTGVSYGMGRLANGLVGPFIVAFLFKTLRLHDRVRLHRGLLGAGRGAGDDVRSEDAGPRARLVQVFDHQQLERDLVARRR